MTGFSESRRQAVHMTMASFALLLRVLAWWQAALCAVAAFLFNLFVLLGFTAGDGTQYFVAQGGTHRFVGIDGQYPVAAGQIKRPVLLRPETRPVGDLDTGAELAANLGRSIRTPRIEYNHLVGKSN